ncbi:hypothetical protein AVEN_66558-1 [Araneus ventricosus]|uniref:Uncharacterized protein n=1 Tax=Araneus ventricosus TaxID=182803 RepID=A0A4Y2EII8_ARAVE|nr:hypothetical protein AVEN_66558-1 [Araneus ventricosus]
MRRTPDPKLFGHLHQWLSGGGSFHRAVMSRERTAQTPDIEETVLDLVQENPSSSSRAITQRAKISRRWRTPCERDMHPYHLQHI